jgi:site-specific DNA-methyltransferase (adenine-specific)
VLTASQPFTSALVMSNPKWFRYCWVWEKRFGVGCNAHHRPIVKHEDIAVFSPASCGNGSEFGMAYNPQGVIPCDKRYVKIDGGGAHSHRPGRVPVVRNVHQTLTGFPNSVIRVPQETTSAGRVHPTQKPVALMEYLIRTYTNEGETVLDNTMGSGTTGVACVNTGRAFIGIEKDAEYFAVAGKRIAVAKAERESLLIPA